MRLLVPAAAVIAALLAAPQARADESDTPVTREEVREKKRELREMERELRRQERDDAREVREERRHRVRFWLGAGAGVGWGAVDTACQPNAFGADCREEGSLNTYTANATLAGRDGALRLRGLRQADKGDDRRTPYETAALIGTRFGGSDWYGMAGYGRVHHPDDDALEDRAAGFAWEILFAPSSPGLTGLELSFQGNSGEDVDFVAFNIGMRIGALR